MSRIRICQMITDLGPGGAERSVYELATRMDPDRFEVEVLALRGGIVGDWLADAGIPVTVLGMRGKRDFLKLRRLEGLFRAGRYDIVHTHLFHADLAGRAPARLAAVPHLIHTVRTAEGRFRPWQFGYARFLAGYCDRVVCISESVRKHHKLHSGLPDWKYTVIHNGVDCEAFAPQESSRRRLRRKWGVSEATVVVACVGRLVHEKGVDMLLSAISHLGARGEAIDVVIAGDGPQRPIVENFIAFGEGGGHCRMLGFVRDVPELLSAVDMLVMPSRWEGFGLAAAEAMAAGLAVIGTDVPGLRDVVVSGETGLLIERGKSVVLAEAILSLAADKARREAMGQAGRQRVEQKFRVEWTVAAHEALYAEVAAREPETDCVDGLPVE